MHRRQLARDDARRERKAAADRGVEPFADDVDLAIVEVPVGNDARMAGEEVAQERDQELTTERLAHADLERAARLVVGRAYAGDGGLQRSERAVDLAQEPFALLGQCQAARAAMEQAHAEAGLEARDVLADARRRQAEDARRRREAAVLGRLHEGDQVLDVGHEGS